MMNYWIYLVPLLVLLAAAAWAARHHTLRRLSEADLESRLRPVDLEAFEALRRSLQARCLNTLPARHSRAVRRRLSRGAMDYLERVRNNAALYAELGQRASRSADAELAAAGRELAQMAFTARLQASAALYRTAVRVVFPATQLSAKWVPVYAAVELPFARLRSLHATRAA